MPHIGGAAGFGLLGSGGRRAIGQTKLAQIAQTRRLLGVSGLQFGQAVVIVQGAPSIGQQAGQAWDAPGRNGGQKSSVFVV